MLPYDRAFFLGILLTFSSVWQSGCRSGRSTVDKIVAIVFPVSAFVVAGFEHSVANMYFIPLALMIKWFAPDTLWTMLAQTPANYGELTASAFLANLIPVTVGNIIGGGVLVGGVYWFVYLRKRTS